MRHLAHVPVVLRPDNLSGESRDFDVIVGIADASEVAHVSTASMELQPGTVIADFAFADHPDDPFWTGTLFEVTDGPLNELDSQPGLGDEVLFTVSPYVNLFASGMLLQVVDGPDGDTRWLHPATGMLLAMFPILAGEVWNAVGQLDSRLTLVEGYLQNLAAALAESPITPDDLPAPTPTDLPLVTPAGEPVPEDPAPLEPATPEIPTFGQDPAPADTEADTPVDIPVPDPVLEDPENPVIPGDATGDPVDTDVDTEPVTDVADEAPEPEVIPVDVVAEPDALPEADAPADGTEIGQLDSEQPAGTDPAIGLADPIPAVVPDDTESTPTADPVADPTPDPLEEPTMTDEPTTDDAATDAPVAGEEQPTAADFDTLDAATPDEPAAPKSDGAEGGTETSGWANWPGNAE